MASSEKTSPGESPPYTEQPCYQPQPDYPVQPCEKHQTGYWLGFPPQYDYPPPPPYQQVQQSTTVHIFSGGMPASQTVMSPVNPRPKSHLGLSIFTCLCCCWPLGLAAIKYSRMANKSYDAGDYDAALKYADIANWLIAASYFCGFLLIIVVVTSTLLAP